MKIGDVEYPSLKGSVSDVEWATRVELAAIYRLYVLFGWEDLLQSAAAARIPGEPHYLFVPAGCVWDEVTASSLVKITIDGKIVSETPFGIIDDFWFPQRAVFEARDDVNFVIHTHDAYAQAFSIRNEEILPATQTSAFLLVGKVALHAYEGVETHAHAMPGLQQSLGDASVMLLRGHGALSVGRSAYEAVLRMEQLLFACKIQLLAGGGEELYRLPSEVTDTFPYELERAAKYLSQWPGILRKLERIDSSYRD